MRNSIKSIGLFALMLFVFSCSKENKGANTNRILEEASSVQSSVSAKSFVDSNEELAPEVNLKNPEFAKELSDTEVAKLKAAVYRFYRTVDVKDDLYYTSLESAEEINISKDLFKMFKDNLDHMNRNIQRAKAQQGEVSVQEVTPEYLESLLR